MVNRWKFKKRYHEGKKSYLQALERVYNVFEEREQRQKKLGKPLTFSESGLSESDYGVQVQKNVLRITGEIKRKVKLPSHKELTPERDILDLLEASYGEEYRSLHNVYHKEVPIDWIFVAPLL
jgi:hypothetical protein